MSRLTEAVLRSDISAMKEAIALGDDLNEQDCGMAPLLWAIFGGYVDVVRLLLEGGADPNLRPNLSGSPLWHAEDDFGLTQISELLKSYGAVKATGEMTL
ncbi:MAG: ankyrin repeat domain-containing protein [Terriglobales bacterium]